LHHVVVLSPSEQEAAPQHHVPAEAHQAEHRGAAAAAASADHGTTVPSEATAAAAAPAVSASAEPGAALVSAASAAAARAAFALSAAAKEFVPPVPAQAQAPSVLRNTKRAKRRSAAAAAARESKAREGDALSSDAIAGPPASLSAASPPVAIVEDGAGGGGNRGRSDGSGSGGRSGGATRAPAWGAASRGGSSVVSGSTEAQGAVAGAPPPPLTAKGVDHVPIRAPEGGGRRGGTKGRGATARSTQQTDGNVGDSSRRQPERRGPPAAAPLSYGDALRKAKPQVAATAVAATAAATTAAPPPRVAQSPSRQGVRESAHPSRPGPGPDKPKTRESTKSSGKDAPTSEAPPAGAVAAGAPSLQESRALPTVDAFPSLGKAMPGVIRLRSRPAPTSSQWPAQRSHGGWPSPAERQAAPHGGEDFFLKPRKATPLFHASAASPSPSAAAAAGAASSPPPPTGGGSVWMQAGARKKLAATSTTEAPQQRSVDAAPREGSKRAPRAPPPSMLGDLVANMLEKGKKPEKKKAPTVAGSKSGLQITSSIRAATAPSPGAAATGGALIRGRAKSGNASAARVGVGGANRSRNPLDSSAPVHIRGKERASPKKKKVCALCVCGGGGVADLCQLLCMCMSLWFEHALTILCAHVHTKCKHVPHPTGTHASA
jgi:hypothetical protein